ncbi:MAG: DinB family protein [Chloroflexota bacterium]
MDAIQFFIMRYEALHGELQQNLLTSMSEAQLRARPLDGFNSVVRHLWHMTRCEDIGVNRLVADVPQVIDGRWFRRLGINTADIATGMTDVEVSDLSDRVRVDQLLEYRRAVRVRTRAVLGDLPPKRLDEPLSDAQLSVVIAEGVLGPNASGVEQYWADRHRG